MTSSHGNDGETSAGHPGAAAHPVQSDSNGDRHPGTISQAAPLGSVERRGTPYGACRTTPSHTYTRTPRGDDHD